MKTKLALSIDRRKVAMLRKASARKGKSISELVENLADKSDEQPTPEGEGEANILKWRGFWAKHVTEADFEADDRAGAELRKTKAYERMQKAGGKHPAQFPSERKDPRSLI
jgi:hypothetical protein